MNNIIQILKNHTNVDEWRMNNTRIHSTELFFIKDKLQMNRAKDVEHIGLTIYKNFEVDEKKYKGSSTIKINPTDNDNDISEKINQAVLAASFVKNEYYTLPKPSKHKSPKLESKFQQGDVIETITEIVKELYQEEKNSSAFVNSTEFFIDKRMNRIINSNGIDVSFESYYGMLEMITEENGETEAIELFDIVYFSDFDRNFIKETIKEQLKYTSLRAKAIPLPNIKDIPVVIRGKSMNEFWDYYLSQSDAGQKYQHLHENNIGDNIQGEDVIGDKVSITLKPMIPNSANNRYFDEDGVFLKDTPILEQGIIKNLIAWNRFAYYYDLPTTGHLRNIDVSAGKLTETELRKAPYLEVISFSAFQMDAMTGYFGGEFRLAIYHDGKNNIPVTLGTVSANIKEAQKEMYLSKERVQSNNIMAPKIIKFNKMTIAGNELAEGE